MHEIVCHSETPEDTRAMGAAVARALAPGDVVSLSGDLGAGKTCFVQGAAPVLGVRARVQSPSFVLVREYAGDVRVVHADVYRLNSLQELFDLGYEELFDPRAVVFVEWGDAVSGALPPERLEIVMTRDGNESRRVVVRSDGAAWESRFDSVEEALAPWTVKQ